MKYFWLLSPSGHLSGQMPDLPCDMGRHGLYVPKKIVGSQIGQTTLSEKERDVQSINKFGPFSEKEMKV